MKVYGIAMIAFGVGLIGLAVLGSVFGILGLCSVIGGAVVFRIEEES